MVRGQFGVLSFKANAPNRTVLLSLGSINNPDTPIAWSVAVNTPIADLLTGIGVTVMPDAPWENYRVGAGEQYADNFITFQRDLSIFGDSYVYEDENGDLRAMTPSTENRTPAITISPDQFTILRRYTNSQSRRGFRRHGQVVKTLQGTIETIDYTYPFGSVIPNSEPGGVGSLTLLSGSENNTNAIYRLALNPVAEANLIARESELANITISRSPVPSSNLNPSGHWVTQSNSVSGSPFETYNYRFRNASIFDMNIRWSGLAANQYRRDEMILRGAVTFHMHFFDGEFEASNLTITLPGTPFGFLPENAIAMCESDTLLIEQKLTRYGQYIPAVTRLVFPLAQTTKARFDAMMEIKPGAVVNAVIDSSNLGIRNRSYVMYAEVRYPNKAIPLYEVHLVSFADLTRRQVRYNQRDVIYEGEDVVYN